MNWKKRLSAVLSLDLLTMMFTYIFAYLNSDRLVGTYLANSITELWSISLFALGGIFMLIGGLIGIGWAETKADTHTIKWGITIGPKYMIDRVKERPKIREKQISGGFFIFLYGAILMVLAIALIPFY
jgi:hypothetical protein